MLHGGVAECPSILALLSNGGDGRTLEFSCGPVRPGKCRRNEEPSRGPGRLGAVVRLLQYFVSRPPRGSLGAQQRAFNSFRALYNEERPHTALGGQPPASQYVTSPRPYPTRLPPLEYPGHFLVKRITNAGTFRFKDRLLLIANALKQHHIGLEESDTGIWSIYFGPVLLARLNERDHIIRG